MLKFKKWLFKKYFYKEVLEDLKTDKFREIISCEAEYLLDVLPLSEGRSIIEYRIFVIFVSSFKKFYGVK